MRLFHLGPTLGWIGISLLFSGMLPANVLLNIGGSVGDFETRRQSVEGSLPSTSSGAGEAESIGVVAESFIPDVAMDEARPVFQFNLSDMGAVDPANNVVGEAILRLSLVSVSGTPEFGIEAWGRDDNLSAPILDGDANAGGQFASSAYSRADQAGLDLNFSGIATPTELEIDVSGFMRERYDAFLGGGDGWVLFRLQPDSSPSVADNPDTSYLFASADNADSGLNPEMELTLVPEPVSTTVIFGGLSSLLVLVRRISRR